MVEHHVKVRTANSIWLEWDGRRLAWECDAAKSLCGEVELCIDGIVFERIAAAVAGGHNEHDFAISPNGCEEMEFSLRAGGAVVGSPWRVLHGRAAAAGVDAWEGAPRTMRPLPDVALPQWTQVPTAAILVPIYNSPLLAHRCIRAVLRWAQRPARLILIDDASEDAGVADLLQDYEHRDRIVVRRNPRNLGYTRSCNLGIELAGDADVVLLNSDTEVGPRWLEVLRQVAYSDVSIGTVTAVSDNAGAFSVPELEQSCPIPARWTLPMAQRALLQQAGGCLPELPTGNGFCMYVKRAMLDRVGVLDATAFPSGYGEENDLCQRAERAGFRHVIAGNVLVHHERSASFGDTRRAALGAQGMQVLRARYPDYEANVGATLYSFARRVLDYRVRRIYAEHDRAHATLPPRPRLLLTQRAAAHAAALQACYECFVLASAGQRMSLHRYAEPEPELLEQGGDGDLRIWLVRYAIELIDCHAADVATPALRRAASSVGVPLADSSGASESTPEQSIPMENETSVPMRCRHRYQAARRAQAGFPAFAGDE
jgi:GT2 family glycosyltransferase